MKLELILIEKFLKGTISFKEKAALKKWVLDDPANMDLFKSKIKNYNPDTLADFNADIAYQKFINSIEGVKHKSKLHYEILKYAAIFIIVFAIGYQVTEIEKTKDFTDENVVTNENIPENKGEIVITLSDGTKRIINSENDNPVTDAKGNIVANNNANSLSFSSNESPISDELVYNEIYIPFGEKFKITLSDGTLVHLNSGSRLRFPQSFVSKSSERKVFLEGEGFFEVTKNEQKPFIVNANDLDIKVLGTKFNVSSYATDESVTATLVEGAVSVSKNSAPDVKMNLTPNYQASYNKKENSLNKAFVDTDVYTAWMQDKLIINNLKFPEILIKLERLHNVKFINEANNLNNEIYKGEFRNEDLETILKTMALSTPFNYEIKQNVITISN